MFYHTNFKPPGHAGTAFNCPNCNAYANQSWSHFKISNRSRSLILVGGADPDNDFRDSQYDLTEYSLSHCFHCEKIAIWNKQRIVYPHDSSTVPLPNGDLPVEVIEDYLEARDVVSRSPRAAAAILRVALEKLLINQQIKGDSINNRIITLIKDGLPVVIKDSLDILRVVGNSAVHPGTLDIKDDYKTAEALFMLINLIGYHLITQPSVIKQIYDKLPDSYKESIQKRDEKLGAT